MSFIRVSGKVRFRNSTAVHPPTLLTSKDTVNLMHLLTRTVRFNLHAASDSCLASGSASDGSAGSNGEGGKPAMTGFGSHYECEVRCSGEPDARTGYLINIKDIDQAVRTGTVPRVAKAIAAGAGPAGLMNELLDDLRGRLPVRVESVGLRLSPYLIYETCGGTDMAGGEVIIRQMLEFSAAHRLHVPALSDDENRAIFGKCNNPGGHGHNYRVEPAVAVDPAAPLSVDAIERITDRVVIERFDHKHLNDQTDEFATEGGVNPSVENIAKVCFGLLQGPIADAGGTLRAVTVWETDRTSAQYPG